MNVGRLAELYLKGRMSFAEFMKLAPHDPSDKEAAELIVIEHEPRRGGFLGTDPQAHDRYMARIQELVRLITSRRSDPKSDWRLQGQERYLAAAELVFRQYRRNPRDNSCDHDHCAFCWAKFMVEDWPDVLHEGYCTLDDYHWICEGCSHDFQALFLWKVVDPSGPGKQ